MASIDVLIVGAGPSGLFMALFLKKLGVPFRIIDKNTSFSGKSKALAIQSRSLEIFAQLDILDSFLQKGKKLKGATFFQGKKKLGHVCFEKIHSPYPFPLALEQNETENILREKLSSLGVLLETGVELIGLHQEDDKVHLTLKKGEKEESLQALWVIGCDGAHSFIRKSLSLSFKGKLFKDLFSLTDIYMKGPLSEEDLSLFLEPKGVMAVFPLPEKQKFRLIFQMEKYRNFLKNTSSLEHGIISSKELPNPTLKEAETMLQSYVKEKIELFNPVWMAHFHINSRLTTSYQENRVFLVGDAAHIHSPVGGQGMNTGFQDAFNLAWKLSYVIQKKSAFSLLNSYQKERESVGKTLLKATEKASFMATLHALWFICLRNFILSFLLKKEAFQKKITKAISQTGIRYPKGTFLFESGRFPSSIKLGERAPDILFYQGEEKTSLFALQKKSLSYCLLLFFLREKSEKIENPWLEKAVAKLPIKVFWISTQKQTKDSFLYDLSGKAHQLYVGEKEGIYLIRPDGHISFRTTSLPLHCLQEHLQKLFLFV